MRLAVSKHLLYNYIGWSGGFGRFFIRFLAVRAIVFFRSVFSFLLFKSIDFFFELSYLLLYYVGPARKLVFQSCYSQLFPLILKPLRQLHEFALSYLLPVWVLRLFYLDIALQIHYLDL